MFVTRLIFTFLSKNILKTGLLAAFSTFLCQMYAQKTAEIVENNLAVSPFPTVQCFPNPANVGIEMTIQLHFVTPADSENSAFFVRVSDESGRAVFESILPDEIQFLLTETKFQSGLYFIQYFENNRLFETEELWIK